MLQPIFSSLEYAMKKQQENVPILPYLMHTYISGLGVCVCVYVEECVYDFILLMVFMLIFNLSSAANKEKRGKYIMRNCL